MQHSSQHVPIQCVNQLMKAEVLLSRVQDRRTGVLLRFMTAAVEKHVG